MLRVTKLTDYATVVMTVLAKSTVGLHSANELAQIAGLEVPTVSKVLKPLAQAGLVESYRGTHGGYRLSRDASRISLLEIVESIEGPLAMTACNDHVNGCDMQPQCDAASNWQWVNNVLAETLAGIDLASMIDSASRQRPSTEAARRQIHAVLQTPSESS